MKKWETIALAFVAGGLATYLLIHSGVIAAPMKLGQSLPYHNYPPPYPTTGVAKVF